MGREINGVRHSDFADLPDADTDSRGLLEIGGLSADSSPEQEATELRMMLSGCSDPSHRSLLLGS